MTLAAFAGSDLGTRKVVYDDRDAILYALAVGAGPEDLELVYERRLRVLPTFALTLGLWVADAASAAGAFTPEGSLHGAQRLTVHKELPVDGEFEVRGRLEAVWDKGKSAVVDVVAESEFFSAAYSIFLPGQGGFGGERGPRGEQSCSVSADAPEWTGNVVTARGQAALYRLTGDRHLIHIDPQAAREAGFTRPILHGLCTLGMAARAVAAAVDAAPWQLTELAARFSAPVLPGDTVRLRARGEHQAVAFTAEAAGTTVLSAGEARFA
ncbi:MaoC/PaaZ C-terminal domain-containing protein [Saccharopolyspora sp. NPDC000995]